MDNIESGNSLPECKSYIDIENNYGSVCRVNGLYTVNPIAGGKRLQPAVITLDDGTDLLRSYRPVQEEFGFIGKRVVVTGTVYTDAGQPPEVQQVMSPHIYPESITLAPGEVPHDTTPDTLPTPPLVESATAVTGHQGKWVSLYATLESLSKREDETTWSDCRLRFADGSRLIVEWVSHTRLQKYIPGEITLTLRVSEVTTEDSGMKHITAGMHAVCPGRVERCGMDNYEKPQKKRPF
jgi:hypothetical protein